MARLLLFFAFLTLIPFAAGAEEVCADQQNGWKAFCLRDAAQVADEENSRTYWELQNKIKALPASVGPRGYTDQLRSLLRKNELDFTNYSESYCNMQVVLADADTELDRILACQIQTAQLRKQELGHIIESVDKKQAGR